MTGLDVMRRVVIILRVVQRPYNAVLVGTVCQHRQVFTDPDLRVAPRDRLEGTTDCQLGIRLHVKCLQLAGATKQVDKKHRTGAGFPLARGGLRLEQSRQVQPQQPGTADLEQLPACQTVAATTWITEDREHEAITEKEVSLLGLNITVDPFNCHA